jgi:hypothetical protein
MRMGAALRVYLIGWKNFVMSCFQVSLWSVAMALPLLVLMLLAPDSLEGKGERAWLVRPLAVAVMIVWIPLVSYMLGELFFESDFRNRKKKRTGIDEELQLLLRSIGDSEDR